MTRIGCSPAVWCALLVPLLAGCPMVENLLREGPEIEKGDIATDERDPILRIDQKLGSYIACRDSLDGPVSESWARYTEHVDESGQPTRRNRAFIYPVGKASFRICNEVLAEAPERPPPMPEIERSARDTVQAARTYADLSREANAYFESRGFEQDEWATLAALHPKLVEAHDAWERHDAVLQLYFDTEKSINDPKFLEILSTDGKTLEYATRALMVSARPLARCFDSPESSAEQCQALFSGLDLAYQGFERAYQAERGAADRVFWMRAFVEDAKSFHAQAHSSSVNMDDKRVRARDTEDVLLLYKRLVRDANTLDFDFP